MANKKNKSAPRTKRRGLTMTPSTKALIESLHRHYEGVLREKSGGMGRLTEEEAILLALSDAAKLHGVEVKS